jgi:hypothetical protein
MLLRSGQQRTRPVFDEAYHENPKVTQLVCGKSVAGTLWARRSHPFRGQHLARRHQPTEGDYSNMAGGSSMRKLSVLVVGQTPPPFGGQSIMIQKLLEGHYDLVHLYHVRMAFSGNMGEVGSFKFRKIIELLKVIINITKSFLQHRPDILLYHPSGPNFWPILRDIAVLISTRWLFPKTIFVFRAGGLGEFYQNASILAQVCHEASLLQS